MPVRDWFSGGDRRLRKAVETLTETFRAGPPTGPALDRAARAYREAVELTLPRDPQQAATFVTRYDAHLPAGRYPFGPADHQWLAGFVDGADPDALTVVFTIASRVPLPDLQRAARDRLVGTVAPVGRADLLVGHLLRIRAAGLLDAATLGTAMTVHLERARLDDDEPLWRGFLADLPEETRPDLFEMHRFLGNGADAVRLATTPAQRLRAVELCAASNRKPDHDAGLRLANDLDRPDLLSILHEKVGNVADALRYCPADRPDRVGGGGGVDPGGAAGAVGHRADADGEDRRQPGAEQETHGEDLPRRLEREFDVVHADPSVREQRRARPARPRPTRR
ncbi:hypothetical protein GCM10009558_007940 [Virgisporangium aurantiacum]